MFSNTKSKGSLLELIYGKLTWSTVESWETTDCLVSMVMTEVGGWAVAENAFQHQYCSEAEKKNHGF